jgi:hypothetical protein
MRVLRLQQPRAAAHVVAASLNKNRTINSVSKKSRRGFHAAPPKTGARITSAGEYY